MRWELSRRFTGKLVHEVTFGAVEADQCVWTQLENLELLSCGLLNSFSESDESEDNDCVLLVRHLLLDPHCSFCVGVLNLGLREVVHTSVTYARFDLWYVEFEPLSDSTVRLEWVLFETGDTGL